ncbi:MAG: hypothetical protein ACLQGV_00770 [Bryobacteraceae bacterium]
MGRIFAGKLALVVRSAVPIIAILACSCAVPTCAQPQKQSPPGFLAVLVDAASKKPVPSVRIVLAPKKEGKLECTIDTSLTGMSNERGEVRIPNVGPGEYVVFYSPSASLYPGLNAKVVNYDAETGQHRGDIDNLEAIRGSLGRMMAPKGAISFGANRHGRLVVLSGYMFSLDFNLAMIFVSEGEFLKVRIPGSGHDPQRIEIRTDFPPPNPPRGAPKNSQ